MIDPAAVRARLDEVVAAMKREGAWDAERPPEEAFEDMGAFGSRTMAFVQWLRWVFVPNVERLLGEGGPWPDGSAVGVMAAREGDTDAVVAALVPSLAAFDALFSEDDEEDDQEDDAQPPSDVAQPPSDNRAGWAILSRPGATPAELQEAVACFRRSIARDPGTPEAANNLGVALLRLGRPGDAVEELERVAAGDGRLAATAHNWLGWYFTAKDCDLRRALAHLAEADRLRPRWGVVWLNRAKALDMAADMAAACAAYGEAIACGDAHDEAYARDRRLQLEMHLLGLGESPPPPPDSAAADSVAFAIVRAVVGVLDRPRAFMIRPTQRARDPRAVIGTIVDGRALGHAIVSGTGKALRAAVLARGDGAIRFRETAVAPGDVDGAAAHLLAWLDAGGADAAAVTPLDLGLTLLDRLAAEGPGASGWSWTIASPQPAALSLYELNGGVSIRVEARAGGGARVTLSPEAVGAPRRVLDVETAARATALLPEMVEATRRALAARDAFPERPFGVRQVMPVIAKAVASIRKKGWRPPEFHESFPTARASLPQGAELVSVVTAEEEAPGECTVRVGRDDAWKVRSVDQLRAVLPAIVEAVRIDIRRLRPERMHPHDRFRVLAPFGPFAAGDEVQLSAILYHPRDVWRAYRLYGPGNATMTLSEELDADTAILDAIDRYLERA